MNTQKSVNGKIKELKRDKFQRSRIDEDSEKYEDSGGRQSPVTLERSATGSSLNNTYPKNNAKDIGDKYRSRSRDATLVFRRHERGRPRHGHSNHGTPETSPGRGSLNSDSSRIEGRSNLRSRFGAGSLNLENSSCRENYHDPLSKRGYSEGSCSEETRLLRLIQRFERETERERQIISLRHLKDFFHNSDHVKTLSSNLSTITTMLVNVVERRFHGDVRQEMAFTFGTLGSILGQDSKNFLQWIFSTYNSLNLDDSKILVLRILQESLKQDKNSKNFAKLIPMIMSNMQTALENADLPSLLVAIVDVIVFIADLYPTIFRNHFRDTVDILVGWHIDSTQTIFLTQFTSQSLISFQPFWVADISFSLTLLSQFLEDMEAYAEDLVQSNYIGDGLGSDDQDPSVEECIAKITSLIRVFTTVLKSLGSHGSPNQSTSVTWEFLVESLKSLLKCVLMTCDYAYQDDLLTTANHCASLLVSLCQSHSVACSDQLLKYISCLHLQPVATMKEEQLLSLLHLMLQVVRELATQLPIEFVQYVFAPDSLCQQLRFWPSKKVQQQLLSLQRAVLGLKNVPVLEEAYRCLLIDLQSTYSVLLKSEIHLVASASQTVLPLSQEKAEVAVLSSLCILAEIGNAKHSIIGMWALKPSFFELVANCLQPTNSELACQYPSVHYAVLYTLYSHCSRHLHFISSSTLIVHALSPSSGSPILSSVITPPSSGHLSSILTLLTSLLGDRNIPFDSRLLSIRWSHEIIDGLQHQSSKMCHVREFCNFLGALVGTAFSTSSVLSKSSCLALQALVKSAGSSLPENLLKKCYAACILHISSHSSVLREVYGALLSLLPLNVVISGFPYNGVENERHETARLLGAKEWSVQNLSLARHSIMNRGLSYSFSSQAFRRLMAFILLGTKPKDRNWLVRTFCNSQQLEQPSEVEHLLYDIGLCSSNLTWFWGTWECAQHCVNNRLRTSLGKPPETFTTIEAALKSYARSTAKHSSSKLSSKSLNEGQTELFRVKLLLDFMESLEKLMYNAYEGCAVALPSAPKNVRAFFRTNKGTCQEWLSRVRLAILVVAQQAGQFPMAVRHCFNLLREKVESDTAHGSDFERILMQLVLSLVALQSPEALQGLYVWCKEKVNVRYLWIKAAAHQAAGRYEAAVTEYANVLEVEELNKKSTDETEHFLEPQADQYLQSHLIRQMAACYTSLGSWEDVNKWMDTYNKTKWTQNGMLANCFDADTDSAYIRALSFFEETLKPTSGLFAKNQFDTEPLLPKVCREEGKHWQIDAQLRDIRHSLVFTAVSFLSKSKSTSIDVTSTTNEIQKASQHLMSLMNITSHDWLPHILPAHAISYLPASSCLGIFQKGKKASPGMLAESVKLNPADHDPGVLTLSLAFTCMWQLVLSKEQGIRPQPSSILELQLVAARLARKQQNLKLAEKLLLKSLCNVSLPEIVGNESSLLLEMLRRAATTLPFSEKLLKIQREGAKLLFASSDTSGAMDVLSSSILLCTQLLASNGKREKSDARSNLDLGFIGQHGAHSLLTLAKYIQQDSKGFSQVLTLDSHPMKKQILNSANMNEFARSGYLSSDERSLHVLEIQTPLLESNGIVGSTDSLIGNLLKQSIYHCPKLAKAWSMLAAWCYRWGRKTVDTSSNGYFELLPMEKEEILSVIPESVSPEEKDVLLQVMSQIHSTPDGELDDLNLDMYMDGASLTKRQILFSCPSLEGTPALDKLLQLWCRIVRRAYCYYELAAKAYFQYLQLNGQQCLDGKYEDDNVTATLRLLRLMVKHASELRDVLEKELAKTPTAPWRGIIPQLFSRLNHPEPYVRQSISDLLCRVAQASPHLIVFPAVVGSLTLKSGTLQQDPNLFAACLSQDLVRLSQSEEAVTSPSLESVDQVVSALLQEEEEEEDEELESLEEDGQKVAIMRNCFTALVETLGRQDARTIAEVKNLVHELRRITLLWDELWLGSLNLHHAEMNRRIRTLEEEIKKVQSNSTLSKEEKLTLIQQKHHIFMKPTLFILEQLHAISSQPPETPHEQQFQDTFMQAIENTLQGLRSPADPVRPQTSWNIFRQLYQSLQRRVQNQTRSNIAMDHISPVLAQLQSSVIPMPGINTQSGSMVTIAGVHGNISVLPTKTRPKKLAFYGSDGHKYTYLFKGLEDLHLDERIMQFLSIVNNMFSKNKRHDKVLYNARHYSVTPLGPRSGLIEWVDGATPLFGLYKRWQQREVTAQALRNQNQNTSTTNNGPTSILRPSEIYYNKLAPLLKEKDITNFDNRKEWPLSILLQVLKELMAETPSDLLAKELWCSSSSALEWWEVIQTYNHSTAVMSVIGYIIGLGDRHLDNVLVDLSTGEVVHIDYNVCFEKGKNLRVPEKVPFRMTPNIETALGVTGVEGMFRMSCEHVLRVLRKGRETLLTLLEAFVYDPLVDWTPGNEGGYTGAVYGGGQVETKQAKQEMEREIAGSLLAVRVAEMSVEWCKNRDELLASLPKLEKILRKAVEAQSELHAIEIKLQEACQQRALLEEAAADPNHSLYTIAERYKEYAVIKEMVTSTKASVIEKIAECKKWQSLHQAALASVTGPDLGKWCSQLTNELSESQFSISLVADFLQTAGQGPLVQQCEQAESDLASVLHQQKIALSNCVELLTTYATVVFHYTPEYRTKNRSYQWQQWLESLLADFTMLRCQEIISEFHSKYGAESMDVSCVQAAISINFQLQALVADVNSKLVALLERRHLEGLEDTCALSSATKQARTGITHFLEEDLEGGSLSFKCVAVTVLSALCKRLLVMESAAAVAGECLVDMTSWGGDWFLDEVYSMCNSITQLLSIVPHQLDSREMFLAFQTVSAAYSVFSALEDMSLNFQSIILPEAIKTMQADESSMRQMVERLEEMTANVGVAELAQQLEKTIRLSIMEPRESVESLPSVQILRQKFQDLVKVEPNVSELTPGQMLFMGLNGLFTKLESDMSILLSSVDSLQIPTPWRKIDVMREAAAITPPFHLDSTKHLLRDVFFLKKLQSMLSFFHLCQQLVKSLSESTRESSSLLTEENLFKPIKIFIAEYVQKQVLGLPSQTVAYATCLLMNSLDFDLTVEIELRDIGAESKVSLDELAKLCLKTECLQAGQLAQASTMASNFDSACRKENLGRRLEQGIGLLKASLQRAQLQLARHQWLYEDLLVQGNVGPLQNLSPPTRSTIMSEMKKNVQALQSLESSVLVGHERYLSLTASVEQRLKWAAGANPSLAATQEEFETAISHKTHQIGVATQLSRELVNSCNAILHFEALRTRTSEALSSDSIFLTLINKCQESCMLSESCENQVSALEEQLLELSSLPDTGRVTQKWIELLLEKISQSLALSKEQLEEKKRENFARMDSTKNHVSNIRNLLSTHHRLMSDLRNILKTLARHEEQAGQMDGPVHSYINLYKQFSEQVSTIVRDVLMENDDSSNYDHLELQLEQLTTLTQEVYNSLLTLAGPVSKDNAKELGSAEEQKAKKGNRSSVLEEGGKVTSLSLRPQELLSISPSSQGQRPLPPKKGSVTRDPRTGKVVQERNSYATNVWKRVKMKLDGRDPDSTKRSVISEQVDYIIKEATNLDNLAVLYEGWTPWV